MPKERINVGKLTVEIRYGIPVKIYHKTFEGRLPGSDELYFRDCEAVMQEYFKKWRESGIDPHVIYYEGSFVRLFHKLEQIKIIKREDHFI